MKSDFIPFGIPDREFIRGDVPMTKQEVRVIALSKLQMERDSVLVDIGAGTGSVSIESALCLTGGLVHAVEKEAEAVDLIKQNCDKFKVTNIDIHQGNASAIVPGIGIFDRAFIGGSGGELAEILAVVDRHIQRNGIIVANVITLQSLSVLREFFIEHNYEFEIIQVAVTRITGPAKAAMLKANNPVYIFRARKE